MRYLLHSIALSAAVALVTVAGGCASRSTIPASVSASQDSEQLTTLPALSLVSQVRLYVSDTGYPIGTISIFQLPLLSTSHAIASIAGDGRPSGMAFDSYKRLFVANWLNRRVQVFAQPIRNGATPAFTLGVPFNPSDAAVDATNDLVVGGYKICGENDVCGNLSYFAAPVGSSSVPRFTIVPFSEVQAVSFDASGDLWVTFRYYLDGMDEYAPPITDHSLPSLRIRGAQAPRYPVFDKGGNMYALTSAGIGFYKRPFTATMKPVYTIPVFSSSCNCSGYALSFDSSGNLYVSTGPQLLKFAPPFSALSKPVARVVANAYGGIAFGP